MQISRFVLLLAGVLGTSAAQAIPMTWRATGTVDDTPPPFLFPFAVTAGDRVDFDYRFDTATACVMCESDQARYDNLASSLTVRVNDSAREIPLGMSSLYLANDHPVRDGYLDAFVLTFRGNDADLDFAGTLALQNVLPTRPVTPLDGVELASLTVPPDPRAFPPSGLPGVDSNFFTFSVSMDGGFNNFGGELGSAAVLSPDPPHDTTSVPEPSTTPLMLTGLLGLMFVNKSRRRRDASGPSIDGR